MGLSAAGIIGLILAVVFFVAVAIPISIATLNGVIVANTISAESTGSSITNGSTYTVLNKPINAPNGNAVLSITNASGTTLTTANYTLLGFDSTKNSYNGTISFYNINATNFRPGLVSYDYQQAAYDTSSTDRTILSIIPLGLAVALLIAVFSMVGGAL